MTVQKYARQFRDIVFKLSRAINSVGVLFLMAMMFLMVVDVFLRRVFQNPLTGSFEVVQFMQVTLVFLGVAYTTIKKAHISIDLITARLSERTSALLESIMLFLGLGLFALITWRNILRAEELWAEKATSVLLEIPLFPFYYMLAFGCGVLCLVLIVQLVESASKAFKGFHGLRAGVMYAFALGVIFFAVALAAHWIEWEMEPLLAGVLGILILLSLMALGMPIAFSMGLVGFAGYCYVVGVDASFSQLESVPYGVGSDYILSVLPLFLLMGQFAFYSGLSQELYDTSYKWLGHYPGGLAMATIGGCASFAAVCGSSVATSATMGTVALPAMRKYGYDDRLALGSIAAGGTVGILIPPSIVFILYGVLTEQSIGKLFLAGFLPGVLAIILYLLAIMIQVRLNPALGPPGPRVSFREKLLSLRQTWGTLLLFSVVMGGIYLGFFTPTEAGAVGAFGAFLMAIFKKRLTLKILNDCLLETGRMTAMLIIIFVGAMLFNYFLAVTNLPMDMAQLIADQDMNRYLVLTAILIVYLMLGCIMDPGSMIILTIPIVFPLIQSLQFNPIWFGVIIVMVAEIGTITPPVGLNVFVVKAVAPEVPITQIFRGIFPFWSVDMVRLVILVSIPQISLFLPNVMRQITDRFMRRYSLDYEDFLRLVKTRKSVRRYKSEPVSDEVLEKILEAARQAPSAGNSQPWEFVVVKDPEIKKKVSKGIALKIKEEVGKDPDIARGIAVQPFLYTAPVIIAVCGDPRLQDAYPAWMDRYALMRQSLSNCIYTLQLAAACFGLATAWATIQSGPTQDALKKILGIPEGYTVDHMVPVGYADEQAEDKQATLRTVKKRARFRRDLDDLVHHEHYRMEKYRSDEAVKAFLWENTVTRIPKS